MAFQGFEQRFGSGAVLINQIAARVSGEGHQDGCGGDEHEVGIANRASELLFDYEMGAQKGQRNTEPGGDCAEFTVVVQVVLNARNASSCLRDSISGEGGQNGPGSAQGEQEVAGLERPDPVGKEANGVEEGTREDESNGKVYGEGMKVQGFAFGVLGGAV